MAATKGNGLGAANDQPVKKASKYASYFIATCTRIATISGATSVTIAVLLVHTLIVRLGVM